MEEMHFEHRHKLKFSEKSHLLEHAAYKYSLQDSKDPNLYREIFDYDSVPKASFNFRSVPMHMPEEIWITDTTFRDGQQSRSPYTVKEITTLFDMLHRQVHIIIV